MRSFEDLISGLKRQRQKRSELDLKTKEDVCKVFSDAIQGFKLLSTRIRTDNYIPQTDGLYQPTLESLGTRKQQTNLLTSSQTPGMGGLTDFPAAQTL